MRRFQPAPSIIATGARYRKPALANLSNSKAPASTTRHHMEARSCATATTSSWSAAPTRPGQAAVFLAQTAKRRVHVLVRSHGLSETMSRYLIRRIEETPTIQLTPEPNRRARGRRAPGTCALARRADRRGHTSRVRHVFLMIGAVANTAWLDGVVALDAKGFVKTGHGPVSRTIWPSARWPLSRPPYLLETCRPGVFAVGDVRAGNVKRVASAVGEGSIAVSFVHQVLQKSIDRTLERSHEGQLLHAYRGSDDRKAPEAARVRGVREDRRLRLGAPPNVSGVRRARCAATTRRTEHATRHARGADIR